MSGGGVRVAAFARVLPIHGAGGMQAVTTDLVQGLAAEGYDIDLFTTERPGQQRAVEEEIAGPLRTVYLWTGAPGRYSRNWFRAADREFRRRVAAGAYDAIISFSAATRGLLQRWRRAGIQIPVMMVTFGTHVDEFRAAVHSLQVDRTIGALTESFLRAGHVIYRAVRDIAFMRAPDVVVASCPGDARKIATVFRIPMARIRVIPYGVTAPLRQRLQRLVDPDGRRLTVVARLERDKGIQVCLRALGRVRESVPDATLRIIGDGPYRGALEALAREIGVAEITEFVGSVAYDRLAEAYAGATVVINPRLRPTAYDHALVVGMATGRPVVASDIGDVSFVATNGRDALLVPVGDTNELARAIVTVLTDRTLADTIGRAGRARVEAMFTMERTIATYSELLTNLSRRAPAVAS